MATADGRLLGVDAAKGELLGQTLGRVLKAGQGFLGDVPSPVAGDGKVFAARADGTILAVPSGAPHRW